MPRIYVPRFLSGFGGDVHTCAKHARCAHLVLLGFIPRDGTTFGVEGGDQLAGWPGSFTFTRSTAPILFGSQEARRVMCSFSIWTAVTVIDTPLFFSSNKQIYYICSAYLLQLEIHSTYIGGKTACGQSRDSS